MKEYLENRIEELKEQCSIINRSSLDTDLPKHERELCEEVCLKVLFGIEELQKALNYLTATQ